MAVQFAVDGPGETELNGEGAMPDEDALLRIGPKRVLHDFATTEEDNFDGSSDDGRMFADDSPGPGAKQAAAAQMKAAAGFAANMAAEQILLVDGVYQLCFMDRNRELAAGLSDAVAAFAALDELFMSGPSSVLLVIDGFHLLSGRATL